MLKTSSVWWLVILVTSAPLALGGMRWQIMLGLCAMALMALVLTSAARLRRGMALPWPLWMAVALVAVTAFQLIPLSPGLLESVSPAAAAVRETSLADLGAWPESAPISLSPSATWLALFHQIGFLAVALAVANSGRRHRRRLLAALMWSGAAVTLIGLMQWAAGTDRIFGVFAPQSGIRLTGFFSTFINSNTLAGFLCLTGVIGLGVIADAPAGKTQMQAVFCTTLSLIGCGLTGSRGGQLAAVFGGLLFTLLALSRGDRRNESARVRARALGGGVLAVSLIGLLVATLLNDDWGALAHGVGADPKFASWPAATEYAEAYWGVGSGRGTFQFVYPHYQEILVSGTFTHPENIVLQFLTEWGLPITVLAIGAALAGWYRCVKGIGRATDPVQWGLVAALAATTAQQLADFGLESPSLSFPFAAAFGIAIARADQRGGQWGSTPRRGLAIGLAAAAAVCIALLAWKGPTSQRGRADLALKTLTANLSDDALRATAVSIARDHPADYMVPLKTATLLIERQPTGPREALRWLNRALRLFPIGGRAHHVAARALARMGLHDQAAVEYGLALEAQPWQHNVLVREVAQTLKTPDQLYTAIRSSRRAARNLAYVLEAPRRNERLQAVMTRLIEDTPDHVQALTVLAKLCAETGDVACTRKHARRIIKAGRPQVGHYLEALAALKTGDEAAAISALDRAARYGMSDPEFLRSAAKLWIRLDAPRAHKAIKRLQALPSHRAYAHGLLGALHEHHDENDAALGAYRQAYKLQPVPKYALATIRLTQRLGLADETRELIKTARRKWPKHPKIQALTTD